MRLCLYTAIIDEMGGPYNFSELKIEPILSVALFKNSRYNV